ncbi:Transposon TX1 uncharacterized 149 kDa protein [Senna tora]|uniref:Transposon TX1 uncharacterized 149 kDa protein n=1 Tax=Senna tora TaxID=362788 RepID=A0A834TAB0_9FABA|nr:Transposon TX1 uncharacterized 149 kDa protein [Senna tora]
MIGIVLTTALIRVVRAAWDNNLAFQPESLCYVVLNKATFKKGILKRSNKVSEDPLKPVCENLRNDLIGCITQANGKEGTNHSGNITLNCLLAMLEKQGAHAIRTWCLIPIHLEEDILNLHFNERESDVVDVGLDAFMIGYAVEILGAVSIKVRDIGPIFPFFRKNCSIMPMQEKDGESELRIEQKNRAEVICESLRFQIDLRSISNDLFLFPKFFPSTGSTWLGDEYPSLTLVLVSSLAVVLILNEVAGKTFFLLYLRFHYDKVALAPPIVLPVKLAG